MRHGLWRDYKCGIRPSFYAGGSPRKNIYSGDFCTQVPQGLPVCWIEDYDLILSFVGAIYWTGTGIKENPTRPLVLHTLPVKPTRGDGQTEPEGKKRKLSPATNDVPRLISVVEIIKREFKGTGLHQYNEVGCLEASQSGGLVVASGIPNEAGKERQAALEKALEGKHYLPIQRTPYMKITLSQVALPESATKGATYQSPVVKKISRSAKSRNRRRAKKDVPDEAGDDEGGDDDAMDVVPT